MVQLSKSGTVSTRVQSGTDRDKVSGVGGNPMLQLVSRSLRFGNLL